MATTTPISNGTLELWRATLNLPALDADETAFHQERAAQGCPRSTRTLFERNLKLAVRRARRWSDRNPTVDYDDILQVAAIALERAVKGFRPSKGFRFSTYAFKCIDSDLYELIGTEQSPMTLPHEVAMMTLRELHTNPDADDATIAAGINRQIDCVAAARTALNTDRLDRTLRDGSAMTLAETLAAAADTDPAQHVARIAEIEHVEQTYLDRLPALERRVIELRYGIHGDAHTILETANELGRPEYTIRATEQRAIERLQRIATQPSPTPRTLAPRASRTVLITPTTTEAVR